MTAGKNAGKDAGRPGQYGKTNYGGAGLASWSGANECPLCGDDMTDTRQMTKRGGRWIHKSCAPGADDE